MNSLLKVIAISGATLAWTLIHSPHALADRGCSPIDTCQIEKKTWTPKGWKIEYLKTLTMDHLCTGDRFDLQLEPQLGIQVWAFQGDPKSADPIASKPFVSIDLFTYKMTYVVANGAVPASAQALKFQHRLTPRGKSLVEVTCFKK